MKILIPYLSGLEGKDWRKEHRPRYADMCSSIVRKVSGRYDLFKEY